MDWDRYSYVRNNPVNATDPTGHLMCSTDEAETCRSSLKVWVITTAAQFGVRFLGNWSWGDKAAAVSAVYNIGQGIARATGSLNAPTIFGKAFGNLSFTMKSSSEICQGCKGQTAYPNINFVAGVYQRNVAHELGHAFEQAIWNRNGGKYTGTDNPVQWLTEHGIYDGDETDDNLVTGTRSGHYTRWNGRNAPDNGYRGDRSPNQEHALGFTDWETNVNENFADIFLNWALGGFAGSRGDAIFNWVETNMAEWVNSGY